jgi:hypothetical protein
MSDTTNLAMLKDNKNQVDSLLEKIRKNLAKNEGLDPSDQTKVANTIYNDFKTINSILDLMKVDIKSLKNEQTEKMFKDQLTQLKQDTKKLNEEFTQKQNKKSALDNLLLEDIKIKEKANNEMNVQELFNKGDNVVKQSGDAINRVDKKVREQLEMAAEMKRDLHKQSNQIDDTQKNLKEIDYSLKRASKQLATMFKMYATDKIIMCLIIVIVLVIIAIIIVASVGGDKEGNFNVPHDMWITKNTTTTEKTRMLFLN